ncbi:SigmaW regulon antibacterial [compost metagenome]
MKARVVEMRAKVVESESQVPLAMAEALRGGQLGVMDYMNLKNIESDTQMRSSLGKVNDGKSEKE